MASKKQNFDIERQLTDFLQVHIGTKKRLLVAVSGGPDSMALLSACKFVATSLGLKVFAAHFVHHPESAEARSRAQLVWDYCRKLRIRLVSGELTGGDKFKASPEERMRRARYQFLDQAAQKFSCHWILTAHHADDQAETVLMRVLVGTGPRGLIGIPVRRGPYLRPFLRVPRSALLQYCQLRQVPFAEDPANLDLSVPRNRLRHEILPMLKQRVNPEVEGALIRLGRWAEEADEVISDQVERCWAASWRQNSHENLLFPKGKIVLDIDAILPYYKMIRKYALLKAISIAAGTEVALKATDLDRAEALLHAQRTGAQVELPQGVRLIKHGRTLIVGALGESDDQYILVPGKDQRLNGIGCRVCWEPIQTGAHESGAGLVADLTLQNRSHRILLRRAQEGDRFHPLGAPGEKRLFRFLTDRKVSSLDKRQTWVLEAGGKILWVIGHRISEHARVLRPGKRSWRLTLAPLHRKRSAL